MRTKIKTKLLNVIDESNMLNHVWYSFRVCFERLLKRIHLDLLNKIKCCFG